MKERISTIKFNLIFWIIYFLFEWLTMVASNDFSFVYFLRACINVPIAFTVSYLIFYVLFEKLYLTNKKTVFWICQLIVAVVFVLLKRYINYFYLYPLFAPAAKAIPLLSFPKILFEFVSLYLIVSLFGMFLFIRSWYSQQQAIKDLRQENIAAELELLKSQVQPHFIFNMLNNIYSSAFKKSPETAQQILKLSNLIEYSLYDSKKDKVLLDEELTYIRNYVDLQKIRVGDKLDVSINIFDDINGILVPPLLLLPIIENCFKHGVNKSINPSWIRIDISTTDREITFKIENSLENESQSPVSQNSGLGLANVRRRLELMYPNGHDIKIFQEENSFLLVLKLSRIK
jgi:sensor histidine kinase YesM